MQTGPLDVHIARLEDIVTLRMQLHKQLWNNKGHFQLLQFLLMLDYRVRRNKSNSTVTTPKTHAVIRLPVSVAVYILTFLGNKYEGEKEENSWHEKSDEQYAQVVSLGALLNQAETLWTSDTVMVQTHKQHTQSNAEYLNSTNTQTTKLQTHVPSHTTCHSYTHNMLWCVQRRLKMAAPARERTTRTPQSAPKTANKGTRC